MLRLFSLICPAAALVAAAPLTWAEEPGQPDPAIVGLEMAANFSKGLTGSGCRRCHYCDRPTTQNRCLIHVCTRDQLRVRGDRPQPDRGPNVVILDELEKAYLPVPFDHRGHAQMADMAEGCTTCHHYTPAGEEHPACKSCHDVATAGTDIHKPGLKGAYHQQCLNCHREWIDETDCAICHMPKTDFSGDPTRAAIPTKDDILGRVHPPIPEPDTEFYRGRPQPAAASHVIFRHRKHVNQFGLNCVDCHHESSCARCHTKVTEAVKPRTVAEHHRPCLRCHKTDMDGANQNARCERCHWKTDQPKPQPFDHADIGWPLGKYHESRTCRECHLRVPFVELDRNCNACHPDWGMGNFDHRITGQVLDENHADADCTDCHAENEYDRPPTCAECHDEEDDGIAFPAKRPGPTVSFQNAKLLTGSGPG